MKVYGKTYLVITRSSFLIDEEGRVQEAWYRVKADQTVAKAKDALAT
jgi:peroxiredoxin